MGEFIRETGWNVSQIASTAKVTPSAVSQWLGKGNKTIHTIGNIEAAINLERATGYSALWLAKGKGPKKVPERPAQDISNITLPNALFALGYAIARAPEDVRRTTLVMLAEYFQEPGKNADLVPLIDKRLSGELSGQSPSDIHGEAA